MNEQWAAYQGIQKAFAGRVATLYGAGEDVLALQRRVTASWWSGLRRVSARKRAGCSPRRGRTEIGGKLPPDHNNGRVLAAAVDLDTIACVSATEDHTIVVDSEGFAPITVKLDNPMFAKRILARRWR